jgi:hypothetical protein
VAAELSIPPIRDDMAAGDMNSTFGGWEERSMIEGDVEGIYGR